MLDWAAASRWCGELSPGARRLDSDTPSSRLLLVSLVHSWDPLRSSQICIFSIWLLFLPALSILFKPLVAVKTGQSPRPQAAHARPPRLCSCLRTDHPWARGMRSQSAIRPCSPSPLLRHPAGSPGFCLRNFLRKSGQSGRLLSLSLFFF